MSAEELMGKLKAEGSRLISEATRNDTKKVLSLATEYQENGKLRLKIHNVIDIIDDFVDWRKSTSHPISETDARKRVSRVIQEINSLPNCHCVIPTEPTKVHRTTALPTRGELLLDIELTKKILSCLDEWCLSKGDAASYTLLFGSILMSRYGMSERVLISTLAMLRNEMLEEETWLNIPSQPIEGNDIGRYALKLTDYEWSLLKKIQQNFRASGRTESELFFFDGMHKTPELKTRIKKIRYILSRSTTEFLEWWKQSFNNGKKPRVNSWLTLSNAARYIPILEGVPPLWSTLLTRYPLPTTTKTPLLIKPGTSQNSLSKAKKQEEASVSSREFEFPEELTTLPGVWETDTESLPQDWPRHLKNITNKFFNAIKSEVPKPYTKASSKKAIYQILIRHQKEITDVTRNTTSYPHLLLDWAYDLICEQKQVALSSVQSYIQKLTHMSLMESSDILELQFWDDDTVEELQATLRAESTLKESSYAQTLGLMRRWIRFCTSMGLLEEIKLPQIDIDVPISTLRTNIVSPTQSEFLFKNLTHFCLDGSARQMYALIIALGCFGGARISEVAGLTLKDVQIEPVMSYTDLMAPDTTNFSEEDKNLACWINIRGGKTEAARRRIPLHILAPKKVVSVLQRWIVDRKKQCPNKSLDSIALFGPHRNPLAYDKQVLSQSVISVLRDEFGPDIDYHSLRHAAASWLVLRLHSATSENFRKTLAYQFDEIFSMSNCQMALEHFCSSESDDMLRSGNLYESVAKWIGHRHSGTTLQHYVHTLHIIHSDIMHNTYS